jgi:hypothetical protein
VLSVTIDTAVFAPPPIDSPAEEVHKFVTTLLEWRDAMTGDRIDVYASKFAPDVLMNCDLYPIRPQLKELLERAEVVEYDANTVAVLVETLLGRSAKIEDVLGISDVLVDELTIDPDVFSGHVPLALRQEAERCAVVVSIARQYCNEPVIQGHAIAIRAHDFASAVRVRGLLQIIDHERDDLTGLPMAPEYFEGGAFVCSSLHKLLMGLDESAILRAATTESHVIAAIKVALYKRRVTAGQPTDWQDIPEFAIGHEFFASLERHHVESGSELAEKLIRAIVETINRENLAATHWLRTGAGANDPQRMRGRDAAWRRDIDYEYHLHYWECHAGQVELARLVVHGDFSIPE